MKIFSKLAYGIIILGIFGLVVMLIQAPFQLLKTVGMIVAVTGGIYLIYRLIFYKQRNSTEQRAFKKAVKQSKKRVKAKGQKQPTSAMKVRNVKNRPTTHLVVIEGKKNARKKKRANF